MRHSDELDEEIRAAQEAAPVRTTEPTATERANGWTAESLARYRADRDAGAELFVDPNSAFRRAAQRPSVQNSRYSPFRWR